ncbi:MAG TPA: PAS domain S-box protein, partial [Deltaproteobacteria bacterium]|nr:PAS domain S-box protein [Deltaproteobacteria bacterium]
MLKHYRYSLINKLIFSLTLLMLLSATAWMGVARYLPEEPSSAVAAIHFLIVSAVMVWLVMAIVKKPIHQLIEDIRNKEPIESLEIRGAHANSEVGKLADAIFHMRRGLEEKLNKQRDEYQSLFELVPCLITVQDRDYKLLRYNREFSESFAPNPGDYCYKAYKGRDKKCEDCPVEKTFEDGRSHYSKETGVDKDGTTTHWILKTTPIKNDSGEIVAAMEMSLDITHTKQLEEQLARSEKKYQLIFSNIPNPVFVLDCETFQVLDCNDSVGIVYGYTKDELQHKSFLNLFREQERETYASQLKTSSAMNQVTQIGKDNNNIVVNMSIAMSEYMNRSALLVCTRDITKWLETEQQLIQASKMATLGEMATGVAHELNQPLSVIKTGSSFCMKKFQKNEKIGDDIILNIISKIDSNADRAAKIIQHMRQIARKSDPTLESIQINDVLKSASEIFNQQLRIRNIDTVWDIKENLPVIRGDWGRLEQVIINLVVNARDAIEEKWGEKEQPQGEKKITLKTREEDGHVMVEICDTGIGVPDGFRDKIFEPFFTTKEVGKGTGLGLSISYGFVKVCKGDIKIISNPGGGTCFVITFP